MLANQATRGLAPAVPVFASTAGSYRDRVGCQVLSNAGTRLRRWVSDTSRMNSVTPAVISVS